MRKYFSLNRAEKTVLIVGIIGLLAITGIGYLKTQLSDSEAYVPKELETDTDCKVKNDNFLVQKGTKLNTNSENYLDGDDVYKKNFKIDLSKVNVNTLGSYAASATFEDTVLNFKITVVENVNPVITVKNPSFAFVIEGNSQIKEVMDYAAVTAVDALGNNITTSITGWGDKFPEKDQTIVYNLKVTDKYGNTATKDISVAYTILR